MHINCNPHMNCSERSYSFSHQLSPRKFSLMKHPTGSMKELVPKPAEEHLLSVRGEWRQP